MNLYKLKWGGGCCCCGRGLRWLDAMRKTRGSICRIIINYYGIESNNCVLISIGNNCTGCTYTFTYKYAGDCFPTFVIITLVLLLILMLLVLCDHWSSFSLSSVCSGNYLNLIGASDAMRWAMKITVFDGIILAAIRTSQVSSIILFRHTILSTL